MDIESKTSIYEEKEETQEVNPEEQKSEIKSEKENLNTCKHISGVSSYTSICKLLGVDAFIYRIYTNRKAGSLD